MTSAEALFSYIHDLLAGNPHLLAIAEQLDDETADTVATPQPRSGRRAGTTPSPQPAAISTTKRGGSRPHQGRTEQEQAGA